MHDPDGNVTMRYASHLHMCNFVNVAERHCRIVYVRWKRPAVVPSIFTPLWASALAHQYQNLRVILAGTAAERMVPPHGVML
jgi:hypothetical protein